MVFRLIDAKCYCLNGWKMFIRLPDVDPYGLPRRPREGDPREDSNDVDDD